jgi:hypothetical protein
VLSRIVSIATLPLNLWRIRSLRRSILSGNYSAPEELPKSQKYFNGMCNICGCDTSFIYSERESFRESLFCIHCKTISRYRSIAKGILRAILELTSIEAAQSIWQLPSLNNTSLRIYDTQRSFYGLRSTYPIPDLLSKCKWITVETSVYNPSKPLGSKSPHQSNQNIEKLTYADSSFDVVITSDVMEHVRLDDDAHREIRRVLKPGGVYIFTVPSNRDSETVTRVRVIDPSDASKDQFLAEKEFHADTLGGQSLAYRIYGKDLDQKLIDLGFNVDYQYQNIKELGILETELFYCKLKNI